MSYNLKNMTHFDNVYKFLDALIEAMRRDDMDVYSTLMLNYEDLFEESLLKMTDIDAEMIKDAKESYEDMVGKLENEEDRKAFVKRIEDLKTRLTYLYV